MGLWATLAPQVGAAREGEADQLGEVGLGPGPIADPLPYVGPGEPAVGVVGAPSQEPV